MALGCNWARKQPNSRTFLANKSKERIMFVAERFISYVIKNHVCCWEVHLWCNKESWKTSHFHRWRYLVSASMCVSQNWSPCSFAFGEKIDRKIQYVKDRTEGFDDYFPCRKQKCKLEHVKQWVKAFAYHHNDKIIA